MNALGIDIGGTGIKGALVDLSTGTLASHRLRLNTPQPAVPKAVAEVVAHVAETFPSAQDPIGCTFPAIVQDGKIRSAANVDKSWIGKNARKLFTKSCGRPVVVINDADAAGIAEAWVGAAAGHPGVVIVLTLGTGIGSALLLDGHLVPNTEFGHLEINGKTAEKRASNKVREEKGLSFPEWADRLNLFLAALDRLFSPDMIVIGGGVSKQYDLFGPLLKSKAQIVPAALRNQAGIIGAALWANQSGS